MAGKPMIAWTILAARESSLLSRVIVSTDDIQIARIAAEWGAEVPFIRPPELARDESGHLEVCNHAIDWLEAGGHLPGYLVLLQPTSPLRLAADIDGAIQLALDRDADAVIGISALHPHSAHPWLAKTMASDGRLNPFLSTAPATIRRQDVPAAFAINGALYVNKCSSLRTDRSFCPEGTLGYEMPFERAVDVDTQFDFDLAAYLLKQRHVSIHD